MFYKKFLLACSVFLVQSVAFNSYATVPYLESMELGYSISGYSNHLSDTTLSGIDGRIIGAYFRTNYQLLLGFGYRWNIREALSPYVYPSELGYKEVTASLSSRYYPRRLLNFIPYFGAGILFDRIISRIEEEPPKDPPYYLTKTANRLGIVFFLGVRIPISRNLGLLSEGRFTILKNIGCCPAAGYIERLSIVTGLSFRL